MPVWHIDVIKTLPSTVDIGLIHDEANELAPHRRPRTEVQPLGENLAATVEQAQEANPTTSKNIDTSSVESIPGASTTLSFSHSTPSTTLVPLARV